MDANVEKNTTLNNIEGKVVSIPVIDKTLTKSDRSADAKVVGEEISRLDERLDNVDPHFAKNVQYDNASSGLKAINIQSAIDETNTRNYRVVNGVTEWLYPPMEVGVEYRLAERYNNQPVYTKLIDIESWESGGVIELTDVSPRVFKHCGRIGSWTLPFINVSCENQYSCWVTFNNNSGKLALRMWGGTGANGTSGQVQIWYTK